MISLEKALKHYVFILLYGICLQVKFYFKSGVQSASVFWNLNIAIIS